MDVNDYERIRILSQELGITSSASILLISEALLSIFTTFRSQDMKPNNLLIAADGTLKIADFGLAREYADHSAKMSSQVVTRLVNPSLPFFLLSCTHISPLLLSF